MANSNELVLMEELDDELLGEAAGSAAVDPGNQSAEAPQQDQAKAITKLIEMTQRLDERIKSQEVQIGKMKKERQELGVLSQKITDSGGSVIKLARGAEVRHRREGQQPR